MAQHQSALKRARTSEKRRQRNQHYISMMKTAIKRVRDAENREQAQAQLKEIVGLLDQLAAKGIIHRNNAANKKSRLTRFVNAMKQ